MNKVIRLAGWRLQRRMDYSPLKKILFKALAVVLALVIAGLALAAAGEKPLELGLKILQSTFGTNFGREQLLILATPMIITGAAVTLAGRMQLWNMGVEGQLLLGAWAATGIGLFVTGPTSLVLVLMMLCAALAGGLFALIPAWMRMKLGISEILSTILLNYVALQWIIHFSKDPWRDTSAASSSIFYTFRVPYELPFLTGKLHIGILIAVLLVVFMSVFLKGSIWGYEIKSVGANLKAANFAGIPYKRHMMVVMIISGAIAGLAGSIEVAGVVNRLSASVSVNYGWNGVLISILAGESFLAILPYGVFMALLLNGGTILQTQGLSFFIVTALIGLILLLASIGEIAANYHIVRTIPAQFDPGIPEIGVQEVIDQSSE